MTVVDGPVARSERGRRWRDRVAADVTAIGGDLLPRTRAAVPWADRLRIEAFTVRRSERCLAMLAGPDAEFVETAATARRRASLAVLRALADDPRLDPAAAWARVLDDPDALPYGLLDWLDSLGPGGRSAVGAAAVSRAVALAGWLHPARLDAIAVARPSDALEWRVPGTPVFVRGRVDARSGPASPAERRLLVVVDTGWDPDAIAVETAHAALAATLNGAAVPARVTWVHLPTGRSVRIDPTDEVLEGAAARIGAAVVALLAARFGPPAPPTPGHWCATCRRRADCATGSAHLAARTPRVGGLPVPSG